ncbi:cytochrome c peroxidase [Methylomonas sp. AM2-LC]|uniref:cytochrome c peroxidase n=1 Tax=Methylomonas sp. AM2-LC TaxID=3153301 RepID=UPI00326677A4
MRRKATPIYVYITALLCLACNVSQADTSTAAPGYYPLAFQPAAPGSYQLPIIGQAGNGEVITTDNKATTLYQLMDNKLVLLSFIYTSCSDVNGCPLATQVLHKLSRQLQKQPELAKHVRLLTLSFNPEHDKPAAMQHYGEGLNSNTVNWQFLTTQSEQQLKPILNDYPQNIQKIVDKNGEFTGTYSHLLRVYLIDTHQKIRNIYNVDFLHADTVINDIKTLLENPASAKPKTIISHENLFRPGDDKQNYQQTDYQTHSLALELRQGHAANLIEYALKPPLGLPKLPQPANNAVTTDKIALGRKLFYDRRLSFNNTFSCAICHIPEQGFSSNELRTPIGVEGRSIRRNAPTLYNVGYARLLFHDGRENQLEQQAWGPLLAHNEMANPSIGYVVDKIKNSADYNGLFESAFHKPAGMETIGQALASYQRTLNAADSAFDRWYYGKQLQALSLQAQRGFRLFTGKAACNQCHSLDKHYALFSDQNRHNTGIGYREAMQLTPAKKQVQIAPGTFIDVASQQLNTISEVKENDLGYYEISQTPNDRWAYKTPSLRNIALSAPYMHNGSIATLEEVVRFYNAGGVVNENLSPLIKPLGLSEPEIADLVTFLQALTANNIAALVADGFAAPVGESH